MSHKRLLLAAAILAFVIIVSFIFSVPRATEVAQTLQQQPEAETVPSVTLRDTYKKGTHTITGSIQTPNACSQVSAKGAVDSETGNIVVAVTMAAGEGVCLQLPTTMKFSTTVAAPAGVSISVTVNGALATTTAP